MERCSFLQGTAAPADRSTMNARASICPVRSRPEARAWMSCSLRTALTISSCLAVLTLARPSQAAIVDASGSQSPRTVQPAESQVALFRLDLSNHGALADTLTAVTFANHTGGPGGQAELDAELGTLRLARDDGDGVFVPAQDATVGTASVAGGQIRFVGLHQPIALLDSASFFLVANLSTLARDGDDVDVAIASSADIKLAMALVVNGTFPIDPSGDFPVDGMSAAQVQLHALPSTSVSAGATQNLVLDVTVPPNGYEPDVLQRLEVINLGTAQPAADLTTLQVYADDGDGNFEPGQDARLGTLAFAGGGSWLLAGLAQPVPISGLRLFVTADVALFATDARTIRLALPASPANGLTMASDNDGPVDQQVAPSTGRAITTANRVTLSAVPMSPSVARPGTAGLGVLHLTVANQYSTARSVVGLRITNATRGTGSTADLDREIQLVTLRLDGNEDGQLGSVAEDPPVATGLLSGGRANLGGFGWTIPPGASQDAFVTVDVSRLAAADGDSISAIVAGSLDVTFQESTFVAALWPLDSGARVAVDGMVARQVGVGGATSATIGPGEGPLRALQLDIPSNGYRADTLQSLRVVNLGNAVATDVGELRLWRDGGDGVFTGSGDDRDLGALSWGGTDWSSGPVSEAIEAGGTARFWVAASIGGSPSDSVTLRLAVPLGGIALASANDGPLDIPIDGGVTLLISNAPLLSSLEIEPGESVPGQGVIARLIVRNRAPETVSGIVPTPLVAQGAGSLAVQTGPVPSTFDLAPAASDSFTWQLTAASAGSVQLSARAGGTGETSGQSRASLTAVADHHVDVAATTAILSAAVSMPVVVTRGQHGIAPITLTFGNPGGADGAPIRITRVAVRIEDADGADIVPATVLSRATIQSAGSVLASHDTLESSGSSMSFPLPTSPRIAAGASVSFTLTFDVHDSTTAPNFRLVLVGVSAIDATEGPSGRAIPIQLQGAAFPIRTSLARIVASATTLEVATASGAPLRADQGQVAVPLLRFTWTNPGTVGVTSDVRLLSLAIRLSDSTGVTIPHPADVLARVSVRSGAQLLGLRTVYPADDSTLVLALSPALNVPAGAPSEMDIGADLAPSAPRQVVRARLADSVAVDARDVTTGNAVPAIVLSAQGWPVQIEAAAESLLASSAPLFAARTRIGDVGVRAMSVTLHHPGRAGVGRIRLDSLVVSCRDAQRHDIAPASILARLVLRSNGLDVASVSGLPTTGGRAAIPLPQIMLEAGDTARIELAVDVAANAPEGLIELQVAASGITAVDANVGTPVALAPEDGAEFPLASGLTLLDPPARELRATFEDHMPVALAADGREVVAGVVRLRSTAAAGTDTMIVDQLVVRATTPTLGGMAVGAGAQRLEAWTGGALWASSGMLTPDSLVAVLTPAGPLLIPPAATAALELRFRTVASAPPPSLRLGIDSAGVVVRQPLSALLRIDVRPEAGSAFPLWTAAGTFGAASFASSVSNYPNPFAAGHEATRFVYYLRADARVTLRLVTLQGDLVRVSIDQQARGPGLHSDDAWDGRNGRGAVVRNGVYLAELVAEYADGQRDRVLRKVAVAR